MTVKIKAFGPIVVTVLVFGALFWVLWMLYANMDVDPKMDPQGNVISDPYQRSKDLFTVVVSLVTATLGYWYGSDGKAEAQDQLSQAQEQVKDIHGEMV